MVLVVLVVLGVLLVVLGVVLVVLEVVLVLPCKAWGEGDSLQDLGGDGRTVLPCKETVHRGGRPPTRATMHCPTVRPTTASIRCLTDRGRRPLSVLEDPPQERPGRAAPGSKEESAEELRVQKKDLGGVASGPQE